MGRGRRSSGGPPPGGHGGHDVGPGQGRAGKNDGGVDMATPDQRGASGSSPGHLKRQAGEGSARDFAPGHGGDVPGEVARDRGANAVETPEPDSLDREG